MTSRMPQALLAAVERAGFLTRFLSRLWSCFPDAAAPVSFPALLPDAAPVFALPPTVILIIIPWFLEIYAH